MRGVNAGLLTKPDTGQGALRGNVTGPLLGIYVTASKGP